MAGRNSEEPISILPPCGGEEHAIDAHNESPTTRFGPVPRLAARPSSSVRPVSGPAKCTQPARTSRPMRPKQLTQAHHRAASILSCAQKRQQLSSLFAGAGSTSLGATERRVAPRRSSENTTPRRTRGTSAPPLIWSQPGKRPDHNNRQRKGHHHTNPHRMAHTIEGPSIT